MKLKEHEKLSNFKKILKIPKE